ncbi:uncharacterized protein METZ01_LOCUS54202, partial [marine metagenome]
VDFTASLSAALPASAAAAPAAPAAAGCRLLYRDPPTLELGALER